MNPYPPLAGFLFENHLNLAFLINGISIALSTIIIFMRIKDVHREQDESPASGYEADIDSKVSALSYIRHNRVVLHLHHGVHIRRDIQHPLLLAVSDKEDSSLT